MAIVRSVLTDFPHNQHRPLIIEVGVQIVLIKSTLRPRRLTGLRSQRLWKSVWDGASIPNAKAEKKWSKNGLQDIEAKSLILGGSTTIIKASISLPPTYVWITSRAYRDHTDIARIYFIEIWSYEQPISRKFFQ